MPESDSLPNVEGLTCIQSVFGAKETLDRLETEIRSKGLTIFAEIDHAAGAVEVGLTLRPTSLMIFGNARGGTPLMQAAQTAGIDLPLKILVWEDIAGKTWLSYNEPSWIAHRHGVSGKADLIDKLRATLAAIANVAAGLQGKE
jgi:uncharacterized protein (DUF302 family)